MTEEYIKSYKTLLEYLTTNLIKSPDTMRYGQALFNIVYGLSNELANTVRGTNIDPFYTNDILKIDSFILYITQFMDFPEEIEERNTLWYKSLLRDIIANDKLNRISNL